jgi:hypothetical protein
VVRNTCITFTDVPVISASTLGEEEGGALVVRHKANNKNISANSQRDFENHIMFRVGFLEPKIHFGWD